MCKTLTEAQSPRNYLMMCVRQINPFFIYVGGLINALINSIYYCFCISINIILFLLRISGIFLNTRCFIIIKVMLS